MKYKMIASDFDDTLADGNGNVSERNVEAIQRYISAGGKFVICTGRMISGIIRQARAMGLTGEIIGYQGSVIADIADGEFLSQASIPYETAHAIAEYIENDGAYYQIYDNDTCVISEMNAYAREYMRFTGITPRVTGRPLIEYIEGKRLAPIKMLIITEPKNVNGYIERLTKEFGDKVLVNTSKKYLVEIVLRGVDKGTAVAELANRYGIAREEIICIGDSMNDLPMVEYAGLGVMVANASELALKAADYIAPSCTDDGVAYVIDNIALS